MADANRTIIEPPVDIDFPGTKTVCRGSDCEAPAGTESGATAGGALPAHERGGVKPATARAWRPAI